VSNNLKYSTFSVALLSFNLAYADDKNGNFNTDILSVGAAYVSGQATVYSERDNLLSFNQQGTSAKNYSFEGLSVRFGAWQDIDVTIGGGYYSDYKETIAYRNAPVRTYNQLEGWGNPSLSVSYGLLNDPANPFSIKLVMSATPNIIGNSTSSVTPAVWVGYKINQYSRIYSSFRYQYVTQSNYANQEIFSSGFQYDVSNNLSVNGWGRLSIIDSVGTQKSFNIKDLGVDFIYKMSERLYLTPSFTNSWRSDITTKDNNTTRKATADIQWYQISLKYLF